MSPASNLTATSTNVDGNPNKIRRLEKKLGKLEEKIDVPTEKKFKFNSNRDQFNLNSRVLSDLRAAKKYAKSRRARRRIKCAMKRLEKRNKHVCIADTARSGWKAVELFETSDFAANAKEDRLIKRCDQRALEMMNEEKERQRRNGSRGDAGPSSRFRNAPRSEGTQSEERCYRCGRRDHWSWECRYYKEQRENERREDRS